MRVLWLSAFVIALDQATKAAVLQFIAYEHAIQRSIPIVGDWLRLTFTENPGMAFGITIGPPGTVTVLSIIATCLVAAYVYQVRDGYAPYRWSLSLILGGALGNIIDRVFYGVLLDYGTLFTGRVVDFIHVNLWNGFIPNVVPLIGGSYMELFPIWNVADMSIVIGVVGVLTFHHTFHEQRILAHREETREAAGAEEPTGPASTTSEEGPSNPSLPSDGETEEAPAQSDSWPPHDWPTDA